MFWMRATKDAGRTHLLPQQETHLLPQQDKTKAEGKWVAGGEQSDPQRLHFHL
jgi:hypothetical protein